MKTFYIILLISLTLLTGCVYLKKNQIHVQPIFYASNEYSGQLYYFVGIRFGCTNEYFTLDMENILMPNTEGSKSSNKSGGSSGGSCSGGSCSPR